VFAARASKINGCQRILSNDKFAHVGRLAAVVVCRRTTPEIRPQMKAKVAFIADAIFGQWGGSEELWSQAAKRLVSKGVSVAASVHLVQLVGIKTIMVPHCMETFFIVTDG
jgi:hypothetical protein